MKTIRHKLHQKYTDIKEDCAITTAASKEFAPYLLNMLASLHRNFPNHPKVYVFDIGLTKLQRLELQGIAWVTLIKVPRFVEHWNLCWTWKPWIWSYPKERFVLHIDSGVLILRPLELWFLAIQKHGYLTFNQGQKLAEITPPDFIEKLNLRYLDFEKEEVFAAGVFGFDQKSVAGQAVRESLDLAKKGWGLGWSAKEKHRIKTSLDATQRFCPTFRHDQTLINLTLRKQLGSQQKVWVRPLKKYLGVKSASDHPKQYMWHARRKKQSMRFAYDRHSAHFLAFVANRTIYYLGEKKAKVFENVLRR